MPQEGSSPGIFYSQAASSTKSRMQAQSLCHALVTHSLHSSYSRDTNPSPKACKGHEGEAGGLENKKKGATSGMIIRTAEIILYAM